MAHTRTGQLRVGDADVAEKGGMGGYNYGPGAGAGHYTRGTLDHPVFVVSQVQSSNMSPLGLFGFGWTTALLSMYHTTKVEAGTTSLVWCFALGFGGLAQLLAGMWEARRGKMFGATAFSSYGAFWISLGLYGVLSDTGIFTASGAAPKGLEAVLALWSIFTFLLFLCTLALNAALATLFFLLTITFALLAGGVSHPTTDKVAGWFGVITALSAFYIAFAELFNDTLKKNVLPLGELSFLTRAIGSQAATPYDVNRTDPRGYGPTGVDQRNVVPTEHGQVPQVRGDIGNGNFGQTGTQPGGAEVRPNRPGL